MCAELTASVCGAVRYSTELRGGTAHLHDISTSRPRERRVAYRTNVDAAGITARTPLS
jgi:hypothetical protein